ncbi:NifB/NifX family molybdenum-iron cluster-binding protein [candidate division WOR-3 bacterium]|nr:NifB/NifX family molybdenum-iron cluster-binding protein [candidate division WOR-3 bacterium]
MKVAVPIENGMLNVHFGHCRKVAILSVDEDRKEIVGREDFAPPPHEPGILPKWLSEKGVDVVITGGMGNKAVSFFDQFSIKVVVGAPVEKPEKLVLDYINGKLEATENYCDH